MAEYEVTKMEGVDETDPEISFKVRVPSDAPLFHGSAQGDFPIWSSSPGALLFQLNDSLG